MFQRKTTYDILAIVLNPKKKQKNHSVRVLIFLLFSQKALCVSIESQSHLLVSWKPKR